MWDSEENKVINFIRNLYMLELEGTTIKRAMKAQLELVAHLWSFGHNFSSSLEFLDLHHYFTTRNKERISADLKSFTCQWDIKNIALESTLWVPWGEWRLFSVTLDFSSLFPWTCVSKRRVRVRTKIWSHKSLISPAKRGASQRQRERKHTTPEQFMQNINNSGKRERRRSPFPPHLSTMSKENEVWIFFLSQLTHSHVLVRSSTHTPRKTHAPANHPLSHFYDKQCIYSECFRRRCCCCFPASESKSEVRDVQAGGWHVGWGFVLISRMFGGGEEKKSIHSRILGERKRRKKKFCCVSRSTAVAYSQSCSML